MIDELAQQWYHVTGAQFIDMVLDGTVSETFGGSASLVALVRLLPEGDY